MILLNKTHFIINNKTIVSKLLFYQWTIEVLILLFGRYGQSAPAPACE